MNENGHKDLLLKCTMYNSCTTQQCSSIVHFWLPSRNTFIIISRTPFYFPFFSTRTLYTLLAHILLTTIKNYVLTWVSGIAANDTEFLNSILIISVLIIIVFKWCCNWNYFPWIWILWPFLESCSSLVL